MVNFLIPVYHEQDIIETTLNSIRHHMPEKYEWRITIVYDDPYDPTIPLLKDIAETYPVEIDIIKNRFDPGVINAIKTGFDCVKPGMVIVTMADMSDDYRSLHPMINEAEAGSDIVCATRYSRGGKLIGGPFFKQLLSRISGITLNLLTGIPTSDASNSFKLYKTSLLEAIDIESSGGFEFGIEMTVKAWVAGFTVSEVPTVWRDRTTGKSRFQLCKWFPRYFHWYQWAIRKRWQGYPKR
jgi:dolichol-phosphate mannosyltransferase